MGRPELIAAVEGAIGVDGQQLQFRFKHGDGGVTSIEVHSADVAQMLMQMENIVASLFAAQNEMAKGKSRLFFPTRPMHITAFHGGGSDKGPVLSFEIRAGIRLDFHLDKAQIPQLVGLLRALEALPKSKRNQH